MKSKDLPEKLRKVKVYGRNAVRALFKSRPREILSVVLEMPLKNDFPDLLKWCAKSKIPYNFLTKAELNKIAGGVHHEGIIAFIIPPLTLTLDDWLPADEGLVFILAGVQNPHNVGAIIRSCGFFGVKTVICLENKSISGKLPAASVRTAEGGAEFVSVIYTQDKDELFSVLKQQKFAVIGTTPKGKKELASFKFPERSAVIFGEEKFGLADEILKTCDHLIKISGTGDIQSLNVSATAALISYAWKSRS